MSERKSLRVTASGLMTIVLSLSAGAARAAGEPAPLSEVVSPAQELALALKVRDAFLAEADLVDDEKLVARVRAIGRRVATFSDRPDLPYEFYVLESGYDPSEFQALSMPGGTIVLTRALAELLAGSADEMAFALAHEVSHVALRHHLSPVELMETKGARRFVQRVRRHHELEADRYGALYSVRAGFRLSAAREALDRLARARGGLEEQGDHPTYDARLRELTTFRPVLERSVAAFDAGLQSLATGDVDEALSATSLFVHQFPRSVAGRVNLGTACLVKLTNDSGSPGGLEEPLPLFQKPGIVLRGLYDGELLERARFSFQQALSVQPASPEALLGLALVGLREGDTEAADSMLSRMGTGAEENAELLLARGNVRYLDGEPAAAADLYRRALAAQKDWSAAEKNLAMAYEAIGNRELAANLWRGLVAEPRLGDQARLQLALHAEAAAETALEE